MIRCIERGERVRLKEASDELVEPFRELVEVSMRRLYCEGKVDGQGQGKKQELILEYEGDDGCKNEYAITDIHIEEMSKGKFRAAEGLGMGSGLFITGERLDKKGLRIASFSFQLPRAGSEVTKESLYLQRGTNPEDVRKVANEIELAHNVDAENHKIAQSTQVNLATFFKNCRGIIRSKVFVN